MTSLDAETDSKLIIIIIMIIIIVIKQYNSNVFIDYLKHSILKERNLDAMKFKKINK